MKGLIIIPAYNEEGSIHRVLENLKESLPEHIDVVVVNDGSKDKTYQEVLKAEVSCLNLPCNLGYTGALKSGLKYGLEMGYDYFGFMDADGQHRLEDVLTIFTKFENGEHDLIVGSRWLNTEVEHHSSSSRRAGMLFFSWLTEKLTGQRFTDTTNGMKVMNRHVAKELIQGNFGDFHSEVLIFLHDRGYRISEHPIVVHEREAGTSMYSLNDAVLYPMKNIILIAVFKINSWTLKQFQSS